MTDFLLSLPVLAHPLALVGATVLAAVLIGAPDVRARKGVR